MARRLQSAMEYLMTYGWAILAIAIVMVSLYSLGIFNSGSLQPTATPGSCEVVRTVAQISLAGQCSNLIPKYVGRFNGIQGTGGSYIQIPYYSSLNPAKFTVTLWANVNGDTSQFRSPVTSRCKNNSQNSGYMIYAANSDNWQFWIGNGGSWPSAIGSSVSLNRWVQIVIVYNGSTMSLYTNYTLSGSSSSSIIINPSCPFRIGAGATESASPSYFFDGYLADVQVYNTSLDEGQIKELYQEGAGGYPVDLQHLVAWWPLNGNANDYSGNNRQGTVYNVTWSANWQSGYTAPTS